MYDFGLRFEGEHGLKKLGYKGACLVKPFNKWIDYVKAKDELSSYYLLGVELKPKSIKDLINQSRQFKDTDYLTINNPSRKIFRAAVEKGLVDSISGIELIKEPDRIHQRATLLDKANAKFMANNKVSMVIEFANLKRSYGMRRAMLWGRMKYNAWICIKKKVPIIIASGASNPNELIDSEILKSFAQLLGMNAGQAKQSLSYVQEKILLREKNLN